MPGMTAFVTIIVDERFNTFKVQNSAFLVRSFDSLGVETNGVTPTTHLAIMRDGKIIFVEYSKGLVGATETEIVSDGINDGDKIVVGKYGATASRGKTGMGGGNNRRGGMGGPGGPM